MVLCAENSKTFQRYASKLRKQLSSGSILSANQTSNAGQTTPLPNPVGDFRSSFSIPSVSRHETGTLVEILENPEIIKTGVAVKDDLQNLNKIEELKPAGFEDLAQLAQSLKIEQTGLRT